MRRRTPPPRNEERLIDMTTLENGKNICPNPHLVELEKKEEKMSEASPISEASQDKTQPQDKIHQEIHQEIDTIHLVSPRTGTATSSPKNRN